MELLAPAGSIGVALAAFDAGADAIYAGMKKFNARERGDNFSSEEMAKLIGYAHSIGKKVYLTFNTLVKESEIAEAAETLAELEDMRPDALIVQDFGIVRMIRKFFPNLVIHASTQMALHDSAALETASKMGISRVILERQITLSELKQMKIPENLELEVFIHGALCCCLSGICLFSSWTTGCSGNRGKCKQPCRRLYSSSGREAFYLSTKDLAAEELIPELKKAGVVSLKIEGRLRKADYVSKVVAACRNAIDGKNYELPGEWAREPSLGFYTEESARTLIRRDAPGGIGAVCGRVKHVFPNAFEAELSGRIHVGDKIRVQSPRGGEARAMTLLALSVGGKKVLKAFPGDVCRIPVLGYDGKIPENGFLYRIGESVGSMEKRIGALASGRFPLDFSLTLDENGLRAEAENHFEFSVPLKLEKATRHPLDASTLTDAFSKAPAGLVFTAGRIKSRVDGVFFVPLSLLKSLRNDFYAKAGEFFPESYFHARAAGKVRAVLKERDAFQMRVPAFSDIVETEYPRDLTHECALPFFTPETELDALRGIAKDAYRKGIRIFRASSLAHFRILAEFPDIRIGTLPPLPICNSFAVAELAELGASFVQAHIELGKEDLLPLRKYTVLPLELYTFGRPVLLATRANPGPLRELVSEEERFLIRKDGVLTEILPEKPLSVPALPGFHIFRDLRECSGMENNVSSFNFLRGLA